MAEFGIKPLARVWSSQHGLDIALSDARGIALVTRCVPVATQEDVNELCQMLAEGPFSKALLVSASAKQDTGKTPVIQSTPSELRDVVRELL